MVLVIVAIKISNESINGMQIEYVDLAPLPMLNTDLEVDGRFPPVVEAFRQKILEADGILFASPEYNYSVTRNSSLFLYSSLLMSSLLFGRIISLAYNIHLINRHHCSDLIYEFSLIRINLLYLSIT